MFPVVIATGVMYPILKRDDTPVCLLSQSTGLDTCCGIMHITQVVKHQALCTHNNPSQIK